MNNVNVTILARNEKNLLQSVDELSELKFKRAVTSNVDYAVCDVSSEDSVTQTCQQLLAKCSANRAQTIDYLVNSAGITQNQLLIATSGDNIRSQLETNLFGSILFTKLILKQMLRQRSGSILNIGSVVGANGNIGQSVYSATKAGLVGFTKSLAKEVGPRGIRVNLISPGKCLFLFNFLTQ